MVTYEYVVKGDEIKEVIIVEGADRIIIPTKGISFSRRAEIEMHINELLKMGLQFNKIRHEKNIGEETTEEEKIKRFIKNLSYYARELFLILDREWKPKSEIDKALGFEKGKELAGVLSGITRQAKKVGLVGEDEELIEERLRGKELEYRLTELGMKIKEKLKEL